MKVHAVKASNVEHARPSMGVTGAKALFVLLAFKAASDPVGAADPVPATTSEGGVPPRNKFNYIYYKET